MYLPFLFSFLKKKTIRLNLTFFLILKKNARKQTFQKQGFAGTNKPGSKQQKNLDKWAAKFFKKKLFL